MNEFLTTAEVGARLRKDRIFVLNLLASGELRGFKIGAHWRIEPADLNAYIKSCSNDIADGAA